jgi:hypothetical protein
MECNGLLKWIGRNGMDKTPQILGNVLARMSRRDDYKLRVNAFGLGPPYQVVR